MAPYHNCSTPELAKLQSLARLQEFLAQPRCEQNFEQFERTLGKCMNQIQAEVTANELVRYDVDEPVVLIGGQEFRRCLDKEPKRYLSASGPITVERNLFRAAGKGKTVCPLELRAGLVGDCTPVLARQTSYLMGLMPSADTAGVFVEMDVEGPSASTCDRLPKLINPVWEKQREAWEAALRMQETVPAEATVLAASLDGVMVPDKKAQREAKVAREETQKEGLKPKTGGPAGYREVGCGTVTLYAPAPNDGKEEERKGPHRLSTIRYARAPEVKKKTLTEQLDAEVASILAVRPDLRLVALADGAEENWRYFAGPQWAEATKIVDFGHACEHLKSALAACFGDTVNGRANYEMLRLILRDKAGGVDEVIVALDRLDRKLYREKHSRRRLDLAKERKYFRNQRDRMDYAGYQALGLPIGSGVVEAACKTLATERLKQSGMSWGDGKQPILTIRSLQQSDRWDAGWALIAGAYRTKVELIPQRRAHLRIVREAA